MTRSLTVALLSPLVACGAATPTPNAAVASQVAAPDISFASYHDFAFGIAGPPPPHYQVTPRSLEVQRRLRLLVKSSLEERGLTETKDEPDLIVQLATGSGAGYALRPTTDSPLVLAERAPGPPPALGFIGIDIYAGASGNQLWKASASAEVDATTIDDALLGRGVERMLQGFGSRPSEGTATAPR